MLYFFRHHLVLDHTLTAQSSGPLVSVLQPSRSFKKYTAEYQKFSKIRRRWSSYDLRSTPVRRQSSQESSASDSTSSSTSWSEYTVRKSLVKFRSRKSAKRWSGRRKFGRTPSNTIKQVLDNVLDISKSQEATFGERLFAVLYSWFYGWIIDVYNSLSDEGREKSFIKWSLASLLVTGASIVLTILLALGMYCFNFFVLSLMNAGLIFATIMVALGITSLGFLAIYNYD